MDDWSDARFGRASSFRLTRFRGVISAETVFGTHSILYQRHPSSTPCVHQTGFANCGSSSARSCAFSSLPAAIRSRLVVSTAEAALDAAIAGVGVVSALSFQLPAAVEAGQLEIVLDDFEPEPMSVDILYVGGGLMPRKLRAFCDFATPRLRAALSRSLSSPAANAKGSGTHPK